jgi:conjugative transfer signal peptidase TraF
MAKIIILASMCIVFLIFVFGFEVKISVNVSDSMPRGIYLMTGILDTDFRKNDVVSFCPSEEDMEFFLTRKYISGYVGASCYHRFPPFLKHIIADEGDNIEVKNNSIFLNGVFVKNSNIFNSDKLNRPIYRLPNGYKKTLSKDEYFTFADGVTRSLDSRYLGIIKKENILSKSYFIWRFK